MEDNDECTHSGLVVALQKVLNMHNPYVGVYRFVRDRINSNGVHQLRMRILGKQCRNSKRYNMPTVSEVAALIVGDYESNHHERDIIVETREGMLKRIPTLSKAYFPLQYPLLFPYGEDGWCEGIEYHCPVSGSSIRREYVTLREWVAFRIHHRPFEKSILLYARRLFQQFLVDAYSMIESQRLSWVRAHQNEIRADLYKGLSDAILRGDVSPSGVGKRIVLPSSFTGGARYMQQNYQDAMAICRWAGYPDLFITFTCNPKWPELTLLLGGLNLNAVDRPDLVSRIFKIKLDELIRDIKKGDIFSKAKAGILLLLLKFHVYLVSMFFK